jgi:hypothetical protein
VPITEASPGTANRKKRRSPLCRPFATFPVTVDDDGVVGSVLTGDDEPLDDGVGFRLGPDGEPDVETAGTVATVEAVEVAVADPSRPNATTAPAVPPATTTHPAASAATVARLRPAPGTPTPGTFTHP